jgi:glycosyltransferase involved in cell wall biosynthesis
MKILMIAPEPFFEPRGTPISVYQRLEALSALGHEIDLLTYHVGRDVSIKNVNIHRVRKVKRIEHVRIGPSRAKILLDAFIILKAIKMLILNRYDVIHSHEESAFFCMPLALLFRTRHLYDMHSVLSNQLTNFEYGNRPIFVKIFQLIERMVINSCDAVITVGSDLADYVRLVNPMIRQITIENIALQAYQAPIGPESVTELSKRLDLNGKLPIVYTGTYEKYQGLEMVLEAVKIVREKIPNTMFIFVGAKNRQSRIWTKRAAEQDLSAHTLFLDVVPPEEAMVFLAFADVLISPRLDGTSVPLKIYSYLHSGKPIVATNINAHSQVLSHDTAVMVEPTKEAFAEGIVRVLSDPELANRVGANARELADGKFNFQRYLSKVNQIYQTLNGVIEVEKPRLPQD